MDPKVRAAFDAGPVPEREGMLALRQLILDVAASLPEVGPLEESLRWGEPAYLTPVTRCGSTLRLGRPRAGGFALYCNCQTTLIADFRDLMGESFCYEGNRAVLFRTAEEIDAEKLGLLIARALTWHRRRSGQAMLGRSVRHGSFNDLQVNLRLGRPPGKQQRPEP